MRQIVLDTETTGMNPLEGHRIIEIGCLELENRRLTGRTFHHYLQPDRLIDPEAIAVHGITDEFLIGKPRFQEVAADFVEFVRGAELVIHNAAFDLSFMDHEMKRLDPEFGSFRAICAVLDTLLMARQKHIGQKNTLDALAKRYFVDHRQRSYHGALLDAEILADVYLAMTGGQVGLGLQEEGDEGDGQETVRPLPAGRKPLPIVRATEEEAAAHAARLDILDKSCGGTCIWRQEGLA
ncbi:MAG: DNA polymerase III subunit epsilon [Fluviicoccus sp.]|uniref:DNA polymerase III subunit epsilon n=1 Tax=Fluviicoccus sp. TaxID=2003552 RepID=UPI00271D69CB|nr:DNA polymerase III subunit epsilon [Fluviicoccus sp.]MDO8330822.1 DNA polymerase III subunit epsilon [Fluviicoccus sp.]